MRVIYIISIFNYSILHIFAVFVWRIFGCERKKWRAGLSCRAREAGTLAICFMILSPWPDSHNAEGGSNGGREAHHWRWMRTAAIIACDPEQDIRQSASLGHPEWESCRYAPGSVKLGAESPKRGDYVRTEILLSASANSLSPNGLLRRGRPPTVSAPPIYPEIKSNGIFGLDSRTSCASSAPSIRGIL